MDLKFRCHSGGPHSQKGELGLSPVLSSLQPQGPPSSLALISSFCNKIHLTHAAENSAPWPWQWAGAAHAGAGECWSQWRAGSRSAGLNQATLVLSVACEHHPTPQNPGEGLGQK